VPGAGGEPVAVLVHDRTEGREQHGGAAQGKQVRGGGVVGVRGRVGQPVEVAEVRPAHAQQPRHGVHLGDERRQARAVGLGQGIGGVRAGREQQRVQELVRGEPVPGPQARVAGVVRTHVPGHRGRDGDLAVQVARLDHEIGGHHLGDAGHRPLGVQAAAPQQPAGHHVLDRGRPRADPGRARGRGCRARRSGATGRCRWRGGAGRCRWRGGAGRCRWRGGQRARGQGYPGRQAGHAHGQPAPRPHATPL
jgi:hypothetical protein